jgi:conjugal transfer pilus assembly protein TraB
MLGSGMSGNSRPTAAVTELGEYGDIAIVSGSGAGTKSQKDEDKKKGVKTVYLPGGSFMEATLISGLDAPTTESAKGHPVPVLLRVKAPAQLPSDVRANLRGCFVVADGKGNLATERAELTLVSMSCMDRKGNAVIDQDIKGWIVDEDGRVGLRGVVVAKMGAMIARSMLAGFLGGMGEAFKAASQTTSVSPLGVNTVNTTGEKAVFAGLGQGLSSAFTETQKFYMELARQTLPVISVGATKVVTLVIGKGVSLEIKKSIN